VSNSDAASHDASRDRRWLIGICISLFFGLFGAVMTLLSYWDRSQPRAPALVAPTNVAAPKPVATSIAAPVVAPVIAPPSNEPDDHKGGKKIHHK